MGERMTKCRTSLLAGDRARRKLCRRYQQRPGTAAGQGFGAQSVHIRAGQRVVTCRVRDGRDGSGLLVGVTDQQGVESELAQVHDGSPGATGCGEATKP